MLPEPGSRYQPPDRAAGALAQSPETVHRFFGVESAPGRGARHSGLRSWNAGSPKGDSLAAPEGRPRGLSLVDDVEREVTGELVFYLSTALFCLTATEASVFLPFSCGLRWPGSGRRRARRW